MDLILRYGTDSEDEFDDIDADYDGCLSKVGLKIVPIEGDGNCLFRCFSYHLYGTEEHFAIVRRHCMNYLVMNKEKFAPFIEGDFEEYIEEKNKNQVWGDDVEIQALAEFYGLDLYVFTFSETAKIQRLKHLLFSQEGNKMALSFTNSHYNYIKKISAPVTSDREVTSKDMRTLIEFAQSESLQQADKQNVPGTYERQMLVKAMRNLSVTR